MAASLLTVPGRGLMQAAEPPLSEADPRQRIEAALPSQVLAPPLRPRKLLIFDRNVNYGGHASIPTANLAFTRMGQKTGAFETVVSQDPAIFKPQDLRQFHAVFFNNTVGNLFEDPALRESLAEFVYGGGGLMGVHGTSVAFTRWPGAAEDWPEFGRMLGARGANHRDSDEHVFIRLDDPSHPVNQSFGGQGFDYRDEFFRFQELYSRQKLRVLLTIDTAKTDLKGVPRGNCLRADNDYALAWVRQYGRGRAFYSTIAHNPYVFWDPRMLRFYLAATQFALGDLAAPTTPSGRLTPAVRAQERLGWRLGLAVHRLGHETLFDTVDQAAQAGLFCLSSSDRQVVGRTMGGQLDGRLGPDELRQIRAKLDDAGVRVLTYHVSAAPTSEAGWRGVFEFARQLGVETLTVETVPAPLDALEKLCEEFDLNLAIENQDAKGAARAPRMEALLQACQGRSPRIGVCGNVAAWLRAGTDPAEAVRLLKARLLTLHLHDLNDKTDRGYAVPLGTGVAKTGALLDELHRLKIKPTMFGLERLSGSAHEAADLSESVAFCNKTTLQLAKDLQP